MGGAGFYQVFSQFDFDFRTSRRWDTLHFEVVKFPRTQYETHLGGNSFYLSATMTFEQAEFRRPYILRQHKFWELINKEGNWVTPFLLAVQLDFWTSWSRETFHFERVKISASHKWGGELGGTRFSFNLTLSFEHTGGTRPYIWGEKEFRDFMNTYGRWIAPVIVSVRLWLPNEQEVRDLTL